MQPVRTRMVFSDSAALAGASGQMALSWDGVSEIAMTRAFRSLLWMPGGADRCALSSSSAHGVTAPPPVAPAHPAREPGAGPARPVGPQVGAGIAARSGRVALG